MAARLGIVAMAICKYGPITVDEDWGDEWKKATYLMEYQTTADSMSINRTADGKTSTILILGHDSANAVARMMAEWLRDYEGVEIR
jgi:hypothetical protein